MQLTSYICTEEDLPNILQLVKKHRYIYGVDTETTGIQERSINFIKRVLKQERKNAYVIGIRNSQNLLIAFCTMCFWESIPAWSPLFLYEDSDQLFSNRKQQPLNFGEAMKKCIKIAEDNNIYTGFFVTRYSPTWKRTHDAITEGFPDYIVSEVEILEPYIKTKYSGFEQLLGGMDGINEKTIVIIQFSKSIIFHN
jgi:hypothetical protein